MTVANPSFATKSRLCVPVGVRTDVRLVATDLDGTLLRSTGIISERSAMALRNAADVGLHIVFATARPAWSAAEVVRATSAWDFLLSSNGAAVTEAATGQCVRTVLMPPGTTLAIIDALADHCPDAVWAVDRDADRLVCAKWPNVLASTSALESRVEHLPLGEGVLCLMVVGCPLNVGQALAERFGAICTSSSQGLLEFSAPGADKSSALRWVLDRLSLDWQQVVAYGDGPNDVAMLVSAGTAIAVANGCEEVLRWADLVVEANDEDGVAHHLEALVWCHNQQSGRTER